MLAMTVVLVMTMRRRMETTRTTAAMNMMTG